MSTIDGLLQGGLELHRAGKLREAELYCQQILQAHPEHASAWHLRGVVAYQLGQSETAVQCIVRAIQCDQNNATFYADLGSIYRMIGYPGMAIAACQHALALNPAMADVHHCLGELQSVGGEGEQAVESFRAAARLDPNNAARHGALGDTLRAHGRLSEAQQAQEAAVRLAPQVCRHRFNLARCLYEQGQRREAIDSYNQALRLEPGRPDVRYNRGLARLALGDFEQGWPDFDARLTGRASKLPIWTGEPLESRRLLVRAEHGLGDTLQFIRYVPIVEQRVGEVQVEVQSKLIPLLTQSGFKNLLAPGAVAGECQREIPLMSLPGLLSTNLQSIPRGIPYLSAQPELVDQWRQRLSALGGFKIGIHWQGSLSYTDDRARSFKLVQFATLAAVPGVRLISLQKSTGTEQLAEVAKQFGVVDFGPELDDRAAAFVDTAAVIKNLDLVITSDTSIAHLAGAMGAPVWVALSFAPDWRWMHDRSDSPWYPTMRLFRQRTMGCWAEVFGEMAAALRVLVARCMG